MLNVEGGTRRMRVPGRLAEVCGGSFDTFPWIICNILRIVYIIYSEMPCARTTHRADFRALHPVGGIFTTVHLDTLYSFRDSPHLSVIEGKWKEEVSFVLKLLSTLSLYHHSSV
jgi:hypothetical protein